ncbi:MAG: histidine--tRNA ligase [SAR86 cluster bacterium]|nr:histidine--tRNA ligase [SAR86 cluster bacterium]
MIKTKTIRGMQDIIPAEIQSWQLIENQIRNVFSSYGYEEIRFPLLEFTELFDRSIGAQTDIVSKEMYTFLDRGGDSISLRPEGTAGCLRACLENDLIRTDSPRLWYMGPMFRHERPQKGRFRQFHQASVEAYGMKTPNIDAEVIMLSARLWRAIGINDGIKLEINSLGNETSRKKYTFELKSYLDNFKSDFNKEIITRIEKNPLRILDSKSSEIQDILKDAPKIYDFLDSQSKNYLSEVLNLLEDSGIKFELNSNLVRGLDYYNDTVFEWKTNLLGSQDSICGGGRYDGLVQKISGKESFGVGFSIGLERVILLLDQMDNQSTDKFNQLDAYFICIGDNSFSVAQKLTEEIRDSLPSLKIKLHFGPEKLATQLKRADKEGSRLALILGDNELQKKKVSIKDLRNQKEQKEVSFVNLVKEIKTYIN